MTTTPELTGAAAAALDCLGVAVDDRLLVLCNQPQRKLAQVLAAAARARTRAVQLLEYPTRSRDGEEPPAAVARAILEASAAVAVTTFSISHTRGRRSLSVTLGGR